MYKLNVSQHHLLELVRKYQGSIIMEKGESIEYVQISHVGLYCDWSRLKRLQYLVTLPIEDYDGRSFILFPIVLESIGEGIYKREFAKIDTSRNFGSFDTRRYWGINPQEAINNYNVGHTTGKIEAIYRVNIP